MPHFFYMATIRKDKKRSLRGTGRDVTDRDFITNVRNRRSGAEVSRSFTFVVFDAAIRRHVSSRNLAVWLDGVSCCCWSGCSVTSHSWFLFSFLFFFLIIIIFFSRCVFQCNWFWPPRKSFSFYGYFSRILFFSSVFLFLFFELLNKKPHKCPVVQR